MDPFELLKKDHRKVSQLFEQIEAASGQAKKRIFRQLKNELDVHAHIEEAVFYPALEREPETRDITLEAYEEHRVVKDLLAQLDAATTTDEEWDARLTVLKENVEHHVEEEEGELFDKANDVLTGDQAEQLGTKMQAEKNRQLSGLPATKPTKTKAPAKKSKQTKKPGLIKTLASALGVGGSEPGARKSTKGSKASKATKKTPAKSSKKSTGKAANKSTKRSGGTKATAKRKAPAKSGRKAAARKTSKHR
jgi:Hemerythrin HHE cation binding domain